MCGLWKLKDSALLGCPPIVMVDLPVDLRVKIREEEDLDSRESTFLI